MQSIKFTKFGANSQFGSFQPGDVMRCSQELADHLVKEGVAKSLDIVPVANTAPADKPAVKITKAKK